LDERVRAVVLVVSGEMGAALIRRDWARRSDDMAQNSLGSSRELAKVGCRWNDLPVDQHMLIGFPRPTAVYSRGLTINGRSERRNSCRWFRRPVYRLLGKRDLGVTEVPARYAAPRRRSGLSLHSGGTWPSRRLEGVSRFAERHFKAE